MELTTATSLDRFSTDDIATQITELAGHLNAGSYRWLVLIAEFDRREGWGDGGFTKSCAHWLNWKCGIDRGAAREKIRVAHALGGLPLIAAAMARGELSYSKVRALTRVASAATEEDFLMIALHGTAHHVEILARSFRRALDAAELSREEEQYMTRGADYHHDANGSLVLKLRVPAEAGAVLIQALNVATDDSYDESTTSPEQVSWKKYATYEGLDSEIPPDMSLHSRSHRRADAMVMFAETYLKHNYELLAGGERQQIVVHVDVETLQQGKAGRCELEDGPSVASETARRLACDANVVTIIENSKGEPLNVGRKTRTIPPAIGRALRARDKCCRFPGCDHTRFLDGHHIKHWANGGETKLSNLVRLCRFHHRQLHEGCFHIQVLDDGVLRFSDAQDHALTAGVAMHGDLSSLLSQNKAFGLMIDPTTSVTRWCGEHMDCDHAVGCLVTQHLDNKNVSAETR